MSKRKGVSFVETFFSVGVGASEIDRLRYRKRAVAKNGRLKRELFATELRRDKPFDRITGWAGWTGCDRASFQLILPIPSSCRVFLSFDLIIDNSVRSLSRHFWPRVYSSLGRKSGSPRRHEEHDERLGGTCARRESRRSSPRSHGEHGVRLGMTRAWRHARNVSAMPLVTLSHLWATAPDAYDKLVYAGARTSNSESIGSYWNVHVRN